MKYRFQPIYITLLAFILTLAFSACVDELLYDPNSGPQGDANLELEMMFTPDNGVNLGTRSPGNSIDQIENVFVGVYEDADRDHPENMKLIDSFYFPKDSLFVSYKQQSTDDQDAIHSAVPKKFIRVPGGNHRLLVAANVGDIKASVPTVKAFIEYVPDGKTWDSTNISANNTMSGYFFEGEEPAPATEVGDIIDKSRININAKTRKLTAWLRRSAAKLTVDFDGSGLYENVFVYIKDITIHDIPQTCPLMAVNKPDGNSLPLIKDGESINYADTFNISNIESQYYLLPAITKEGNEYRDLFKNKSPHANNSPVSLFFYENAQGTGTDKRQDADNNGSLDNPGQVIESNELWKDKMPYGTWVEVTGYYVSNSPKGRGRGPIKYRFMLGQNVTTDYNSFRNTHYKLTLHLKGLANDVDWHIDYTDVTSPGILTDVYYVSYLYNQPQISTDNTQTINDYWEKLYPIRIIAKHETEIGETLKVRITENNWGPDIETGDPTGFEYYTGNVWTSDGSNTPTVKKGTLMDYDGIWNGFLSLYAYPGQPTTIAKGHRYSASVYIDWYRRGSNPYFTEFKTTDDPEIFQPYDKDPLPRNQEFDYGEGYREFKTAKGEHTDAKNGSYRVTEENYNGVLTRVVWIPLFTRPLIVSQTKAFSGNNPYYSFQRRAKLKISVDYDGDGVDNDCETYVYQVRRIINPKGIFRSSSNDAPFNISLMHRTGETRQHWFTTFNSEGPWRASLVVNPDNGWQIIGPSSGGTGSSIGVTVKPSAKLGETEHRCALLKFEYHDYKCVHYVVLRQGYAPIKIDNGNSNDLGSFNGPYWHTFNLRSKDEETSHPLDEGSMFRYGNLSQPIDAINNRIYETTLQIVGQTDNKGFFMAPIKESGNTRTKWANIKSYAKQNPGEFSNEEIIQTGWRLPTNKDFGALYKNNDIEFGFGICYADGATGCSDEDNEVHRFSWFANDPKDWETILGFKTDDNNYIDETDLQGAYGMRATFVYNKNDARCIMFPMGHTGYGARKHNINNSHQYGVIGSATGLGQLRYGGVTEPFNNCYVPLLYTLYTQYGALYWLSDCKTWPGKEEARAWDFNYSTMDFGPYPSAEIFDGSNSHAFFIRLVQNTAPTSQSSKRRRSSHR